jgi:hypothetical protein
VVVAVFSCVMCLFQWQAIRILAQVCQLEPVVELLDRCVCSLVTSLTLYCEGSVIICQDEEGELPGGMVGYSV